MNQNEYKALVEKLAGEIIDSALEKEAGIKDVGHTVIEKVKDGAQKAKDMDKTLPGLGVDIGKSIKKNPVKSGVAAAAGIGAGVGLGMLAKKKTAEKAASVLEDGLAKMAASEDVYEQGMAEAEAAASILTELGYDVNELLGGPEDEDEGEVEYESEGEGEE